VTFERACNVSVGIVDGQLAHHPLNPTASRSYDTANAAAQYTRWMQQKLGNQWKVRKHGLRSTVRQYWPVNTTRSLDICMGDAAAQRRSQPLPLDAPVQEGRLLDWCIVMSDTRAFVADGLRALARDGDAYSAVLTINSAFAERHGHGFAHFEWPTSGGDPHRTPACRHPSEGGRVAAWCKVLAVAYIALHGVGGQLCSHILHMDSDAYFVNNLLSLPTYFSQKLLDRDAALLAEGRKRSVGRNWSVLLSNDHPNADPLDGDGCSGVFFVRAGKESCAILRGWWNAHYPSTNLRHPWEQPAINRLMHSLAAHRDEPLSHVLPTAAYFAHHRAYAEKRLRLPWLQGSMLWDGSIVHGRLGSKGVAKYLQQAAKNVLRLNVTFAPNAHLRAEHCSGTGQVMLTTLLHHAGWRFQSSCVPVEKLAFPPVSHECPSLPAQVNADELAPPVNDSSAKACHRGYAGPNVTVLRC